MALQEVPKKLADCFWGNDDEGFQVLMERMKVAKHSTAELQVVLQQRFFTFGDGINIQELILRRNTQRSYLN